MLVLLTSIWPLYVEATQLYGSHEHLMVDVPLALVTLPLSQTAGLIFLIWPRVLLSPYILIFYVVLCGLVQALLLGFLQRWLSRYKESR